MNHNQAFVSLIGAIEAFRDTIAEQNIFHIAEQDVSHKPLTIAEQLSSSRLFDREADGTYANLEMLSSTLLTFFAKMHQQYSNLIFALKQPLIDKIRKSYNELERSVQTAVNIAKELHCSSQVLVQLQMDPRAIGTTSNGKSFSEKFLFINAEKLGMLISALSKAKSQNPEGTALASPLETALSQIGMDPESSLGKWLLELDKAPLIAEFLALESSPISAGLLDQDKNHPLTKYLLALKQEPLIARSTARAEFEAQPRKPLPTANAIVEIPSKAMLSEVGMNLGNTITKLLNALNKLSECVRNNQEFLASTQAPDASAQSPLHQMHAKPSIKPQSEILTKPNNSVVGSPHEGAQSNARSNQPGGDPTTNEPSKPENGSSSPRYRQQLQAIKEEPQRFNTSDNTKNTQRTMQSDPQSSAKVKVSECSPSHQSGQHACSSTNTVKSKDAESKTISQQGQDSNHGANKNKESQSIKLLPTEAPTVSKSNIAANPCSTEISKQKNPTANVDNARTMTTPPTTIRPTLPPLEMRITLNNTMQGGRESGSQRK